MNTIVGSAHPLKRERGRFSYTYRPGGIYNDSYTEECWAADPDGPTVVSEDAPMFDVDYRVVLVDRDMVSSTFDVYVSSKLALFRLRRGVHALAKLGFIRCTDIALLQMSIRAARGTRGRVPVRLTLLAPIRVTPSSTPGHSHLWVERHMDFNVAYKFGRALGFVDRNYLRVCKSGRRWQLNSRPSV